jgi:5-methylcytosine-specific restriction endonuclease McrA
MEAGLLFTCPKRDAVSEIWETLWVRAAGKCEYCSRPITRTGWAKGEMHEEVPRGNGGEISLANSKMICRSCHRNDPRGHADRKLQFSKPFDLEE